MASKNRLKNDDEWLVFADDFNKYVSEVCGNTGTAWGIANSVRPWSGLTSNGGCEKSDFERRNFIGSNKTKLIPIDALPSLNVSDSTASIASNASSTAISKSADLHPQSDLLVKVIVHGNGEGTTNGSISFDKCVLNARSFRIFSVRNDSSKQTVRIRCSTSEIGENDTDLYLLSRWREASAGPDEDQLGLVIKNFTTACVSSFPFGLLKGKSAPTDEVQRVLQAAYDCDEESPRPPEWLPPQAADSENEAVKFVKGVYRFVQSELASPASKYARKVSTSDWISLLPAQSATVLVCFTPSIGTMATGDDGSYKLTDRAISIDVTDALTSTSQDILQTRKLNLSAKVYRSVLSVLQKNINFGRIVIGETVTKFLTLVNNSDVPCMYTILKSGSISSGFLKITRGRRGWIGSRASLTLDFVFKPALPGSFEETLRIENVLDPSDFHTIIVKARVSKPDAFQLYAHTQDDFSLQALQRCAMKELGETMAVALDEHVHIDTEGAGNGPVSMNAAKASQDKPLRAFFLGDIVLGETCDVVITVRLKNVTSKVRQFIVDATHGDVLTLFPPTKTKPASQDDLSASDSNYSVWMWQFNRHDSGSFSSHAPVPFEPLPETLQSIVGMHCRFEMRSCDLSQSGIPNVTLEEKQRLEDKLEHFRQKLKIAVRKGRSDKIAKYERKIKEVNEILGIVSDETEFTSSDFDLSTSDVVDEKPKDKDKAKEKDKEKDKSKNKDKDKDNDEGSDTEVKETLTAPTASMSSLPSIVGASDATLHIKVGPEQSVLLKIKLTMLPSVNYRPWLGPLPFRGFFRVYECRNEDSVKLIRFSAFLSSPSRKTSFPFNPKELIIASSEKQHSQHGGDQFEFDEAFADFKRQMGIFLITVSQWSSYATRHMYPDYRFCSTNVLGMSIKMTQASKERVLEASFSVSSMVMRTATVRLFLIENDLDFGHPLHRYADKIRPYERGQHGPISFASYSRSRPGRRTSIQNTDRRSPNSSFDQGSNPEQEIPFAVNKLKCEVEPLGVRECFVRWEPPSGLPKEELIATSVGVTMSFESEDGDEVTHSQIIPVICFLEHSSSFKLDRSLTFGDVPLGSSKQQSFTITNLSESEELHYLLTPCSWAGTDTVGKVDVPHGHHLTGIVPPAQSKEISLEFFATDMGRFEQELWVSNLIDHFDQKRTLVTASVTVPQSRFVEFPDLELDDNGKFKCLDLGTIQLPVSVVSQSFKELPSADIAEEKKYRLRIRNISDKNLVVTAVSNLKRQCFIFTDATCSELVISKLIPSRQESYLFVVVRPSSSYSSTGNEGVSASSLRSTPSANNSGFATGVKSDRTHAKGRELSGGIRLVFYESEISDLDAVDSADDMTGPNLTYDLTMLRKLFETTVVFKVVVGASVLSVKSPKPSLHYVKMSNPVLSAHVHAFVQGEFVLENISSVFPLLYQYIAHENVAVHGRSVDVPVDWHQMGLCHHKQTISLVIFDDLLCELAPNETKTVKYIFCCHTRTAGLCIQNLKILNLRTGDERSVQLSAFFSNSLISHKASTASADIVTSAETELPIVSFGATTWLRLAETTNTKSLYFHVIGPSHKLLCEWFVSNESDSSLMVTPVSNLPFLQVFVEAGKDLQNKLDFGSTSRGKSSHQELLKRIEKSRKLKDDSAHPSLLAVSQKSLLRKCGNAVSIPLRSTARVLVFVETGVEFSERRLRDLVSKSPSVPVTVRTVLESGALLRLEGMIGLASSTQVLKSFFDPSFSTHVASQHSPPPVSVSKRPTSLDRSMLNLFKPPTQEVIVPSVDSPVVPSPADSNSYTPLEYYCRVHCDVVLPRVIINVKSIDLGSLQVTSNRDVDLATVTNVCDDSLTIVFENVPSWLLIKDVISSSMPQETQIGVKTSQNSPDVDLKAPLSEPNATRSVQIHLQPREKRVVKGLVAMELFDVAAQSQSDAQVQSNHLDAQEVPQAEKESGILAVKQVISVRPVYISADATCNRLRSDSDKDGRYGKCILPCTLFNLFLILYLFDLEFKIRFEIGR